MREKELTCDNRSKTNGFVQGKDHFRVAAEVVSEDFSHLVEKNVFEGIIIVDIKGMVIYANDSAARLLNRSSAELMDVPFGFPISSEKFVEIDIISEGNIIKNVELRSTETEYKSDKVYFISLRDVTENTLLKQELHDMAVKDELTNLLNRRGFFLLANQQFLQAKRLVQDVNSGLMVIFMDVDGLKDVNDNLGHMQGDLLLIETAHILTNTFRDSDIIARMGGDEFVVLTLNTHEKDIVYNRLQENINTYNDKNRASSLLSLSVGISCYNPETCDSLDELLKEADALMYEDKKKKKKTSLDKQGGK
jgi:two-component system cell cycle response regulator